MRVMRCGPHDGMHNGSILVACSKCLNSAFLIPNKSKFPPYPSAGGQQSATTCLDGMCSRCNRTEMRDTHLPLTTSLLCSHHCLFSILRTRFLGLLLVSLRSLPVVASFTRMNWTHSRLFPTLARTTFLLAISSNTPRSLPSSRVKIP